MQQHHLLILLLLSLRTRPKFHSMAASTTMTTARPRCVTRRREIFGFCKTRRKRPCTDAGGKRQRKICLLKIFRRRKRASMFISVKSGGFFSPEEKIASRSSPRGVGSPNQPHHHADSKRQSQQQPFLSLVVCK